MLTRRTFLTLTAALAAARVLPSLPGQPPAPGLAPDGMYEVTALTETETKLIHVEQRYAYSIPGFLEGVKPGDILRKITLIPQEEGDSLGGLKQEDDYFPPIVGSTVTSVNMRKPGAKPDIHHLTPKEFEDLYLNKPIPEDKT